jgi:hypothetical protein
MKVIRNRVITVILLLCGLLAAGGAFAQGPLHDRGRRPHHGPPSPDSYSVENLDEVVSRYRERFGGRVLSAETRERDDGGRVHHIRILGERGKVRRLRVDAETGRVIRPRRRP